MPQPLVQSTGRRKQAIARVRVRTSEGEGDGVITVNKRALADYFPSKTHQMILTEPLRLTELTEAYDIDATIDGGGPTGQAGALRLGIARALDRARPRAARRAQEGRLPHARRAREGVEEVRPQEGPQGSAVLQALGAALLRRRSAIRRHGCLKFGTDGVRGVANVDLTPELVLALGPRRGPGARRRPLRRRRDTRRSGPLLEAALAAGLAAEGVDVDDARVWCRRPAVAWLAAAEGMAGAVISASHNPFADNGIKLFAAGGRKLSDEVEEHAGGRARSPCSAAGAGVGRRTPARPSARSSTARRRATGCGRVGASSRSRGAGSTACGSWSTAPTAPPPRSPRACCGRSAPTVEVLHDRARRHQHQRRLRLDPPRGPAGARSSTHGADVGLAFDGDADRVLADRRRRPAGRRRPDHRHLRHRPARPRAPGQGHRRRHRDDQPRVPARRWREHGIEVLEVPVGDRYVLEALADGGLSLGGEQSGPRHLRRPGHHRRRAADRRAAARHRAPLGSTAGRARRRAR